MCRSLTCIHNIRKTGNDRVGMTNHVNRHHHHYSTLHRKASPIDCCLPPKFARCNRKNEYARWTGSGLTERGEKSSQHMKYYLTVQTHFFNSFHLTGSDMLTAGGCQGSIQTVVPLIYIRKDCEWFS